MATASRKRKRSAHGGSSPAVAIKKRVRGDGQFVATEFTGGDTLRSLLTARGPLPEAEVRAYMRQLLRLTKRAHAAGLVHGDITPDTILVGPDDVAVHLPGFSAPPTITWPQEVGPDGFPYLRTTMQYRSPELLNYIPIFIMCECPTDDTYALGCVMYELVTGKRLFTADTAKEMLDEAEELHDQLLDLEVDFDTLGLGDLSLHGKQVLSGLLQFYDSDRLTAAEALKHRWFTESSGRKRKRATRRTQPAAVEEDA